MHERIISALEEVLDLEPQLDKIEAIISNRKFNELPDVFKELRFDPDPKKTVKYLRDVMDATRRYAREIRSGDSFSEASEHYYAVIAYLSKDVDTIWPKVLLGKIAG